MSNNLGSTAGGEGQKSILEKLLKLLIVTLFGLVGIYSIGGGLQVILRVPKIRASKVISKPSPRP